MIQFQYNGDSTKDEREDAKEYFLNNLGIFKKEFDEKDGFVTVNFDKPKESTDRYNFIFPKHDVHEFIARFNEWKKGQSPSQ